MGKYNRQFYETNGNVGYQSAREVVPFIIKKLNPRSVIDFGCGSGSWCRAFLECNDSIKIKALDGEWVDKDSMLIPQALFQSVDLKKKVAVDEKYDLAVSLEVAEHIEKEYADVFIHNICSAADIVLFSAAIPLWGGDMPCQ